MPAHLPGFYFDVAKNRYFKITPHHLSSEDSKYSADAIKRQQNDSFNREQNAKHLQKQSSTKIHRSAIFTHPLGGRLSFLRELGASKPIVAEAVVDSWARGLERRTAVYKSDSAHRGPDITQFVKDDLTGTFLYSLATLENDEQYIYGAKPSPFQAEEFQEGATYQRAGHTVGDYAFRYPIKGAPISSLTLSSSRVLLATLLGVNPAVTFMRLWDRHPYGSGAEHQFGNYPPDQNVLPPSLRWISTCESEFSEAWASAPNSLLGQTKFAIGFSGRVGVLSIDEDKLDSAIIRRLNDHIFSVDWLDQHTIIYGGQRGHINLLDTRNNCGCMRFQYPAKINHVRKMEGPRIAITGLNESIHIQDMRFIPRPESVRAQEPYMNLPTSGGTIVSHMDAGFDVHGDLIAAATADRRVQLFNVRTGKEVKMGQGEEVSQLKGRARCVKFAEDEGQMMKLYVSSEGTIQELSWA